MPGILINRHNMNGIAQGNGQKAQGVLQGHLSNGLSNGIGYSSNSLDPNGTEDGSEFKRYAAAENTDGRGGVAAATINAPQHFDHLPPELQELTLGFFPLAKLINRSTQQCWNDLEELINGLAEIQVPQQPSHVVNGSGHRPGQNESAQGNQSFQNLEKKEKILKFAQHQRDWFIKLLVLSQWSQNIQKIRRTIDVRTFIDTQKAYINHAAQYFGYLKRDLAMAQVPNPDLKTAAEVLSTGKVSRLPDLGYIPPKPLASKTMLKALRNVNRILCTRLVLHDKLPPAFEKYDVHDGRVTFSIPGEFAVDLSVADEDLSSQFFFIDFRFLFSPSTSLVDDELRNQVEGRVNAILGSDGLTGCFEFLHDLTLTYKLSVLREQLFALTSKYWSGNLRVDLIRRTLVVQYWINRSIPKSWFEIGINSGRLRIKGHQLNQQSRSSYLAIRWMRQKQEIKDAEIAFDTETISMENILRSVIALHTNWILDATYDEISEYGLYKAGLLSLDLNCSFSNPSDCSLKIQLTSLKFLTLFVEPITGTFALKPVSPSSARAVSDLDRSKNPVDDAARRLSFVRCFEAEQQLSAAAYTAGWDLARLPRTTSPTEARQLFPKNVLRFTFFRRPYWNAGWLLAATHSMDSDHWWIVDSATDSSDASTTTVEMIEGYNIHLQDHSRSYFSRLDAHVQGLIALRVNLHALKELGLPAASIKLPEGGPVASSPTPKASWLMPFIPAKIPPGLQLRPPFDAMKAENLLGNTIRVKTKYMAIRKISMITATLYHEMSATLFSLLKAFGLYPFRLLGTNQVELIQEVKVGEPVIKPIYERLQRLNHLLSCLDTLLQYPRLGIKSVSLSEIIFLYPKDLPHTTTIRFHPHPAASDFNSQSPPVALSFSAFSPYRRIYYAFSQNLHSKPNAPSSLNTLIRLLGFTLPILLVFDTMQREVTLQPQPAVTTSPTQFPPSSPYKNLPKFHILSRTARNHLVRFVRPSASFELQPTPRDDGFYWAMQHRLHLNDPPVVARWLKERVFSINAEALGQAKHWVSLDDGAACPVEKPEELMKRVWEVLRDVVAEMGKDDSEGETRVSAGSKGVGGGGGFPSGTKRAASQSPTKARKKVNQGPGQPGTGQPRGGAGGAGSTTANHATKGTMVAKPRQAATKGAAAQQQVIEID